MAEGIPAPQPVDGLDGEILVKEISKIKSENDEKVLAECLRIYTTLTKLDGEKKGVINYLHWQCLESLSLCRPMTLFLNKLLNDVDGNPLVSRSHWLHLLQQDYEAREALCNLTHDHFLGAVQLHGELYHSLLVNSIPFKVLAIPLMDYLTMLLRSGFREDLSVLLHQLTINWKNLKTQLEPDCNKFSVELRQYLLRSQKSQLLLAIDITSTGFPQGLLDEFYEKVLQDEYLALKSRALGQSFQPRKPSYNDGSIGIEAGKVPDVNLVRQRLAAKGLIPRRSIQPEKTSDENDDQFYGKQLPKQRI